MLVLAIKGRKKKTNLELTFVRSGVRNLFAVSKQIFTLSTARSAGIKKLS